MPLRVDGCETCRPRTWRGPSCNGRGDVPCDTCGGTAVITGQPCTGCDGRGYFPCPCICHDDDEHV